jgi:phage-related minor tail protein
MIFRFRDVQTEFRNRIIKELKNVLRTAEKLRERFSQRLMKYIKSLQDKRTRDKLSQSKLLADSTFQIHSFNDKLCNNYHKEMQTYVKNLKEKLVTGQQVFNGTDVRLLTLF